MKRWLIILFIISLGLTVYEISASYGLFETEKDILRKKYFDRYCIICYCNIGEKRK